MRAFTPAAIARLEARIRELSRELIDRKIGRGGMDLAADYAIPLPMMVISEMIGVPSAEWPRFRAWSDGILRLSHVISGGDEAGLAEARSAMGEMKVYVPQMMEERRSAPRNDLLTRLVEAEVDGERLSEKEIVGFVQLLLVAGNETTTNLINNAILCLLENPEELARLRLAPQLLASAIEEALRYRSPVQWVFRAAMWDVEIRGRVIPKGKFVL